MEWGVLDRTADSEPPDGSSVSLQGVSCPGAGSCVAVGSYQDSSGAELGLVETSAETSAGRSGNTGTTSATGTTGWSITQLPVQSWSSSALLGVSCISTADCTAVGNASNAAGMPVPLALSWNGTAWSIDALSDPSGGRGAGFGSVSCESSPACHAVGFYTTRSAAPAELAEVTHPIRPTVTRNPTSVRTADGRRVTFTAAATGTPQPEVVWQTSADGGETWITLTRQTASSYSLTAVKQVSGHEFRALFTNVAGQVASAPATLTVS